MIYHDFQGKQLSMLGFGTMRLPTDGAGHIDEAQVAEMTAYALEHGVNYFDTAYPYHGGEIRARHGAGAEQVSARAVLSGHQVSGASDQQQLRSGRRF